MLQIKIAETIEIFGASKEIIDTIKGVLTIPNPAYFKVARITGSQFAAQKDFKYYKEKDGVLIIPRGMRGRFLAWLEKKKIPYHLDEDYIEQKIKKPFQLLPGKELRAHQIELTEKVVKEREGLCVAGTGTGKTVLGLEIIRKLGLTSLILVPNTVLLDQFYNEAQEYYGLKPSRIGLGRKETNGEVIIATWQSLGADKSLIEELRGKVSVIIVDEASGIVSKERMKILKEFKPKHLLGLTATPSRSRNDGRTAAIHFMLGNTIGEYAPTMIKPTVEVIRTGVEIPWYGNYNEMIDLMINSENRNTLIRGLVLGEVMSGHKVMVLTKRIEHYKKLQEKLPVSDEFIFIDSKDEARNEKLLMMKDGLVSFKAVFGTISLLGVGTDLPQIDTMIICSDLRSDVLTIQMAGRALRWFKGKTSAKIIDLFDDKNPVLKNQFYDRKRVYESKGWEIKGLDWK